MDNLFLFRGIGIDSGDWVKGFCSVMVHESEPEPIHVIEQWNNNGIYQEDIVHSSVVAYPIIRETLGVYTGFRDVYNEQIFTGDYLETNSTRYSYPLKLEVIFHDGSFRVKSSDPNMKFLFELSLFMELTTVMIIGNKFEDYGN